LATIAQVAREAGVGIATVSRVVNGSGAVREETRMRVMQAVRRLGYAPNAAARALSTGHTLRVGVVAPFFTRASVTMRLRGMADRLAEASYQLVLFDVERPEQRDACFGALAGGGTVDAVLSISLAPTAPELKRFAASGMPVVLLDHAHPTLPYVAIDDVAGGRLATEHLLDLGHRRIAFLGDLEDDGYGFTASARRRAGYEEALAGAGIRPDPVLVSSATHGRGSAQAAAARLLALDPPPTAIFAASDEQALGALDAASRANLAVPERLSVVGFDDVEVARWAGLTTVAQPLERSGAAAAELILSAMGGEAVRSCSLELELVERRTSAAPGTKQDAAPSRGGSFRHNRSTRGSSCRDVSQD
jgi:LacI family transcriptional regulator